MNVPLIKIKVLPKPVIKGTMDVRFPTNVLADNPIIIDRTGGNYKFTLDLVALGNYFLSSTSIIPPTLLPTPTTSSLGGIVALTPITHQFVKGIDTTGHPITGQPDASDSTYTSSATSAVATTVNAKLDRIYHVSDWGVKGDGTDETVKLQLALNSCPLGATLEGYPDKAIYVSANGLQCLSMTRYINLRNLWIGMFNTLSTSVDVLAIKPTTGNWFNFRMSNCIIADSSRFRYGRHGIRFYHDNTTQPITSAVLEKLFVGQGAATVGNAIYDDNTGGLDFTGGLAASVIRDSVLCNGMKFIQTGDRNTIQNCQLLGSSTGGSLVDMDFVSGAMNFQFINNNVGQVSLYFRSGLNPYVAYNTFEQTINGYQPNNTVLDFDGGLAQMLAPVAENNVFQMLNSGAPSALVRFNNTREGKLKGGNKLSMATNFIPVIVTGTAIATHISRNQETFTNGAALVSGVNNVTNHDKPVSVRFVGDANATISADTPDHTVSLNTSLTADRTWTLPDLTHCFPGEEFIFQDLTNSLGTLKIILARSGSDTFIDGATSFNMTTPGMRVTLKANPVSGTWQAIIGAAAIRTSMFAANVVDTDGTLTANSDTRLASQKAAKTYVDALSSSITTALAAKLDKTAQHQIFCGNSQSQNIAGGETRFIVTHPFDTTETTIYVPIPIAGTFSNLTIVSNGSPGASQTYTATLRKTLADTALTCQITAGFNTASDNTHTAHFAAGDRLSLKVVSSATAASTPISWSAIFTPD